VSTIFISHSSRDSAIADELSRKLRSERYDVFLDFDRCDGIPTGADWERELYQRLRTCRAVVLLWGDDSPTPWCFAEITQARALGKPIFPVRIGGPEAIPLLRDTQMLDLTADVRRGALDFSRLVADLGRNRIAPRPFPWNGSRPPYPGLTVFDEADAAVYFGREEEIRKGVDALTRSHTGVSGRFLVVLGASGSGKSSLVRAGIIPRLRERDAWVVMEPLRPGLRPFDALALAIEASFGRHGIKRPWQDVRAMFERAAGATACEDSGLLDLAQELRSLAGRRDASVLIVIDQLEELLNLEPVMSGREAAHNRIEHFLIMLRRLAEIPESRITVMCTLRSDFLGVFQRNEALLGLEFVPLPVGPFYPDEFRAIIRGPSDLAGVAVADELVETLVAETRISDALPLLAFTLRELWDRRTPQRPLEIGAYLTDLGGLQGTVANAADELYGALDDAQKRLLRRAMLRLVQIGADRQPTRTLVKWSDLPAEVHPVLERFVKRRLLVSRDEGGTPALEFAHETIFRAWQILATWIEQSRGFLLWQGRLRDRLDEWLNAGAVLQGAVLQEARLWRDREAELLTSDEHALIATSERASRIRKWTTRALVATVVLLLCAAGLYARTKQQIAVDEARRARDAERAAQGEARRARDASLLAIARGTSNATERIEILREASELSPDAEAFAMETVYRGIFSQVVFRGHKGKVHSGAISPDGARLVTAGEDGVRVWDTDGRGGPLFLEKGNVADVAFSPDGTKIVTSSGVSDRSYGAGWARVWNTDGRGQPVVLNHGTMCTHATFSPDGTKVLTVCGRASLWSADGGGQPLVFENEERKEVGIVEYAAFSPDGTRVVVVYGENRAPEVYGADGKGKPVVLEHHGRIRYAAFSPDGAKVVTASADGTARVWPADGRGEVVVLKHEGEVNHAAFSPDGRHIVTASDDRMARLWSVDGRGKVVVLAHDRPVERAAFNSDGTRVVTTVGNETARVWDADGRGQPIVLEHDRQALDNRRKITHAEFGSVGTMVLTTSEDGTARAWKLDSRDQPIGLQHDGGVLQASFSRDGSMVVTSSTDKTVRVWKLDGHNRPTILKHDAQVKLAALSPDGGKVVTASDDAIARVWSLASPGQPIVFRCDNKSMLERAGIRSTISNVAFSSDGTKVITVSSTGNAESIVRVWDADGRSQPVILKPDGKVDHVVISPNGAKVAIVSHGGDRGHVVQLWDGDGRRPVIFGHDARVGNVAFNSDATKMLTVSENGKNIGEATVRVWSTDGGSRPVALRRGCSNYAPEFSANDRKVLQKCINEVRVWGADGRGEPVVLRYDYLVGGTPAISPDGSRVLVPSYNGIARVWSSDGTGQPITLRHDNAIFEGSFSPDGTRLLTISQDRTVRVWRVDGRGQPIILSPNDGRGASFSPDSTRVMTVSGSTAKVWPIDASLALWRATSDCLPAPARVRLLAETEAQASLGEDKCHRTIACLAANGGETQRDRKCLGKH
jgi:WD40 repeat protein